MATRNRARFLAPVALVGAVVVAVAVVDHGLSHPTKGATVSSRSTLTTVSVAHVSTKHAAKTGAGRASSTTSTSGSSYVVKSGDSMSAIAARTGVPLATLEALNPGVDARALRVGQRLRLRP
jgi:LysM repeat protein